MSKSTSKKKLTAWGGARKNSGPKKKDPSRLKKPVTLYIMVSELDRVGGEDSFKDKCYELLKEKKPSEEGPGA